MLIGLIDDTFINEKDKDNIYYNLMSIFKSPSRLKSFMRDKKVPRKTNPNVFTQSNSNIGKLVKSIVRT